MNRGAEKIWSIASMEISAAEFATNSDVNKPAPEKEEKTRSGSTVSSHRRRPST